MRVRRTLPRMVIVLFAVFLFASGVQALKVPSTDADDVNHADDVVRGTISDVRSRWNDDHTHIVTTATVRVLSRAKGQSPETFTLAVLGGTADGMTEWAEEEPVPHDGSEAYIYVKKNMPVGMPAYGRAQKILVVSNGKLPGESPEKDGGTPVADYDWYLSNLAAGKSVVVPEPSETVGSALNDAGTGPVISNVSPNVGSAGTGTMITITGTGFGTKASRESMADVVFLYKHSRRTGKTTEIYASGYKDFNENANDIVSWTDTRIVARIPTGKTVDGYAGGTASSGYLYVLTDDNETSAKVPFSVSFAYGNRKWTGPIRYSVNPGTLPGAAAAIQTAGNTWNAAIPSTPFRFEYQGTTTSTANQDERDGKNIISFSPASEFPDPKIIATASRWFDTNGTVVEADIAFNSGLSWTTGTANEDQVNLQAAALHEMGHWAGLNDLYGCSPGYPSDIGKVMFGYGDFEYGHSNLVALHAGDSAGIRWIYSRSTSGTSTTSEIEQAAFSLTNQERTARGISTLQWDSSLASFARAHSNDMALHGFFGFESSSGQTIEQRFSGAGYDWVNDFLGETINYIEPGTIDGLGDGDNDDPKSVARGIIGELMNDPKIREMILGEDYTRTGIGVVYNGTGYLTTLDYTNARPATAPVIHPPPTFDVIIIPPTAPVIHTPPPTAPVIYTPPTAPVIHTPPTIRPPTVPTAFRPTYPSFIPHA